jgi:butyrate kinase
VFLYENTDYLLNFSKKLIIRTNRPAAFNCPRNGIFFNAILMPEVLIMSNKKFKIFALNFGSTSTKVAMFEDRDLVFEDKVEHDPTAIKNLPSVMDQGDMRIEGIKELLERSGQTLENCDAFVARCGGTGPIHGGTYEVNDVLVKRLLDPTKHHHNADLGGVIAQKLANEFGGRAFFVDSPETDELQPLARITGFKDYYKEASTHTLNQKAVCRYYAEKIGKDYTDLNLVVSHIGGGVSVSAHRKGKIVDSTNLIRGDGPMAPTRSGEIQAIHILDLAYSGKWEKKDLERRITHGGGLMDHLGTADVKEIKQRIENGDTYARYVYDGMIYQIGKYIGMMGAVLEGKVDAILLTGGITRDTYLTDKLTKMCGYLAPVEVIAGEFEMDALGAGAYRVLSGQEEAIEYKEDFSYASLETILKNY